jgi:O-antigen ligase
MAGIFGVTKLTYLNWRINTTELKMYKGEQDDQNGIAIRLFMWKIASRLIAERPVLGYGVRGAKLETLEKYKDQNFELGYKGNYHSHNEYLESWLMGGIPALILLLGMMFIALWNGVVKKNLLLILITAHFMIQSLIESTFEVQQELVFYIFFIFLFFYHAPAFSKTDHS